MPADAKCLGIPDDVEKQAHHIVPVATFKPGDLGDRLCQLGIDLNGPENGVWLPVCQYKKDLRDQPTVHFGRHLGDYDKEVRERLGKANTKQDALSVIGDLRDELCSNSIDLQKTIHPCPGYKL
ncbi:MAG: AHH domain-containing protein [Planctomycetaceae bacterium]